MYDGAHSITFKTLDDQTEYNTWTDLFLIPTSRPTISVPGSQNKIVDIQGMSWSYDNSDYITPILSFSDRTGTFEFLVDNDHVDLSVLRNTLISIFSGQRYKMIFSDDPNWYYDGRFAIDDFKSDPKNSRVTISYRVSPYKISTNDYFMENVVWDTFCFLFDYDWSVLWHISLDDQTLSYNISNYGARTTVYARLVSGESVDIQLGETTITLDTPSDIVSIEPENIIGSEPLVISGIGVIDIGLRKISM